MNNYKKMLILFSILILVLAFIFYTYKEELATYIQENLERSGTALENKNLPKVSDIDETKILNTENINQTRFRVLKDQVPTTFLKDKTSTSTTINNTSLFFSP